MELQCYISLNSLIVKSLTNALIDNSSMSRLTIDVENKKIDFK